MPRSRSLDLDDFDLDIEKTLRALRKQKYASNSSMAKHHNEDKLLRDYGMPSIDRATTIILRPIVQAISILR